MGSVVGINVCKSMPLAWLAYAGKSMRLECVEELGCVVQTHQRLCEPNRVRSMGRNQASCTHALYSEWECGHLQEGQR